VQEPAIGQRSQTMGRPKKKLTRAQKEEKARRRKLFMTVFVNGKQVRVPTTPTIDGVPVDEFIRRNADPIWLLRNEMYELLDEHGDSVSDEDGDQHCDE